MEIVKCDFCPRNADYDFRTIWGPWANGCELHWIRYAMSNRLGVGHGQKLNTKLAAEGK